MSVSIEILNRRPEIPTLPCECALLMAVPLDEEGIRSGLTDGNRDFVRSFVKANGILTEDGMRMSVEGLWHQVYEPIATYSKAVVQYVQEKGVYVSNLVGIAEFAKAISSHRVTTLVAHWKPPLFRGEDIADLDQFIRARDKLRRCRNQQSNLGQLSAEQLADILKIEVEDSDADARERLALSLNRALMGSTTEEGARRIGFETRAQIAFENSRTSLSHLFPEVFRGGAAIELSDGLHPISELAAVIPADWRGTLDLTVCNSTVLGNAVRLRARGSVVLMNEEPADLPARLALYKQVIRMLSHRNQSYMHCMIAMRAYLV
jgi:hypothetical protein